MTDNHHMPLASFYIFERKAPSRPRLDDLSGSICAALAGLGIEEGKLRGKRIAVAVGSRGIANLQEIVRTVCGWLKERGAQLFVIPAMGSHGGATAAGQLQILANYGITESKIGAEICASMEVVVMGATPQGFNVYVGRHAWESDGIVLLNRIKPHSDYFGKVESGLLKMAAIGLGKCEGANEGHRQFFKHGFEPTVRAVSAKILESGKILLGLAVTENEMHETADVRAALPADIAAMEEATLLLARGMLPRIPFQNLHLLVVDEIGKNISGAGMDLKLVGRCPGMPPDDAPAYSMIYLRDLTEESWGNAVGMGQADVIHDRLFRKIDFQKTYLNAVIGLTPWVARMPIHLPCDRAALNLTLGHLGSPEPGSQRIAWIRNTLNLNKIAVSSCIKDQLESPADWKLVAGPFPVEFDAEGDLRSPL